MIFFLEKFVDILSWRRMDEVQLFRFCFRVRKKNPIENESRRISLQNALK